MEFRKHPNECTDYLKNVNLNCIYTHYWHSNFLLNSYFLWIETFPPGERNLFSSPDLLNQLSNCNSPNPRPMTTKALTLTIKFSWGQKLSCWSSCLVLRELQRGWQKYLLCWGGLFSGTAPLSLHVPVTLISSLSYRQTQLFLGLALCSLSGVNSFFFFTYSQAVTEPALQRKKSGFLVLSYPITSIWHSAWHNSCSTKYQWMDMWVNTFPLCMHACVSFL